MESAVLSVVSDLPLWKYVYKIIQTCFAVDAMFT